ncbi:hypothetical protein DV738_g808, partial [Chaetothyriales sp. CBS 135597]
MRAKRSKKYRKIMSAYQMAFSFREPYQVLLDAAFLRTCHAFHMPLQKYLENTLHGQCKIFVTQCTLEKVMKEQEKLLGKRRRPDFLPPPTEVPLRYCKHRNDEGEELGVLEEHHCLLDLVAGQPKGNEVPKNKQHYILATADAADTDDQKKEGQQQQQRRRSKPHIDVRQQARLIPGVPIVYVKRSVMILEELSGASERLRRDAEKEKFREGLVNDRKRKRADGEEEGPEDEMLKELMQDEPAVAPKRGIKKAKGPNPLSVRKKKVKVAHNNTSEEPKTTTKRRGKRGKKKAMGEEGGASEGASASASGAAQGPLSATTPGGDDQGVAVDAE